MDILYGINAVTVLLSSEPARVKQLHVSKERQDKRMQNILQLAERQGVRCIQHDSAYFSNRYPKDNTQGVVAEISAKPTMSEPEIVPYLESRATPLVLILDGVTDPHNLGACLRSADAAGVDLVIAPKDRAAGLTPVVRKVASGAADHIPVVFVTNLARTMDKLKAAGIWLYGLAEEAQSSLYTIDCRGPMALVLGAEGTGLRHLTREKCDGLVHLPMHGIVESLNVSVATGICLYEALRQRQSAHK